MVSFFFRSQKGQEATRLVHKLLNLGFHEGSDEGGEVERGSTTDRGSTKRQGGGRGGEIELKLKIGRRTHRLDVGEKSHFL